MPANPFKLALQQRRTQIGLWLSMADPYVASIVGGTGFDWLLIDGEHAPNDLRSILAQLQALAASPSAAVVRAPMAERWMIKQLLDIGAQTLLVPMIDSAEEAQALVSAARYPPAGRRGMGAALARASRFGADARYAQEADDGVCLLVQAESRAAMANLEAICAVNGVDGVFIGPVDLAADMGFHGRVDAPEVQAVVEDAIRRIIAAGKPAGILTFDEGLNQRYLELGATFVAVGADIRVMTNGLRALAERYARGSAAPPPSAGY